MLQLDIFKRAYFKSDENNELLIKFRIITQLIFQMSHDFWWHFK